MTRPWMLTALGAAGWIVACGPASDGTAASGQGAADSAPGGRAQEALPPGRKLPKDVESMVFGSGDRCRDDAGCDGGACYYGTCIGLLTIDQRWLQEQITGQLVARIGDSKELRQRVVDHLASVVGRDDTAVAYQARALLPLEQLGAREPVQRALTLGDPRLERAAGLALTRMGGDAALPVVGELATDHQPAVAAEALRALGRSGEAAALSYILGALNADLDRTVVRAAVAAARDLGDLRGVRPLVAFMQDAPEFLVRDVARALRVLTGADLGAQPKAWTRWLAEHAEVPAAPDFAVQPAETPFDIGLPAP